MCYTGTPYKYSSGHSVMWYAKQKKSTVLSKKNAPSFSIVQ